VSVKVSAGILLYRGAGGTLELLLAHPGGPYFRNKDLGNWTIPKGAPDGADELLAAGLREFEEETGFRVRDVALDPDVRPLDLGFITQASGKRVHAWAVEGDLDPAGCSSNEFELEWPPGSGRRQTFPEIDRVAWFDVDEARRRANPAQSSLVDRLVAAIDPRPQP
jgi:predicted NUDIX family NTP pyrophosphohydrolase